MVVPFSFSGLPVFLDFRKFSENFEKLDKARNQAEGGKIWKIRKFNRRFQNQSSILQALQRECTACVCTTLPIEQLNQ